MSVEFTKEHVTKNNLKYFKGDALAADVVRDKYLVKRPESGKWLEDSPDKKHKRLAREFSKNRDKYNWDSHKDGLSSYGKKRKELSEEDFYNYFKDYNSIIPQGSIMAMLGNKEVVGSLSNCLQGDTLVLTSEGFKPIKDLSGKTVKILTNGGGWKDAPFKSYGKQKLWKISVKKGKTNNKDFYATGDHTWFVQTKNNTNKSKKIKTNDLKVGNYLKNQFGKGYRGLKPSPFGVAHGITYGDGHTTQSKRYSNNITLCSDSRVLSKYFIDEPISSDEQLCEGGSDFYSGIPNYFRKLPSLQENMSYLYGWLAGYLAADGHVDEGGSCAFNSSKKEDLAHVKDICGILGIGCGEIKTTTIISNLTNKPHTMYKVYIYAQFLTEEFFLLEKHRKRFSPKMDKKPARWRIINVEETSITEEVYCAEVPDTHSFTLEGNILTGNCIVLPELYDSYGGITYADQQLTQLMKRRCGVGLDISPLRPEMAEVKNSALSSTGAVSYMERYSNTTREVAQNGRRGALMITIDCRHPNVDQFITIKQDLKKVTGANISVMFRDDFMQAVEDNAEYTLRWPVESSIEEAEITKVVKAAEIWKLHCEANWKSAEPGNIFIDRMRNYSICDKFPGFRIISTNPCSEIAMSNDSCRLVAVNLFNFVKRPFTSKAYFDYDEAYKTFYEAQMMMDDVVDMEIAAIDKILAKIDSDPEPEHIKRVERETWEQLRKSGVEGRRTGLGITGLGDTLAALGVSYDSSEGMDNIDLIMRTKFKGEWDSSIDMAINRGSFPAQKTDPGVTTQMEEMIKNEFPQLWERHQKWGRRNISISTIAPTGSLSMLASMYSEDIDERFFGVTSGLEPMFNMNPLEAWYVRRRKINPGDEGVKVDYTDDMGDKWTHYRVFHTGFKMWAKINHPDINLQKIPEDSLKNLLKESPYGGSGSSEIDWVKRIEVQALLQKYITHSISSTINLPKTATVEDIDKVYRHGWSKGLKGVTVYRDGCRSGVLISEDDSNKTSNKDKNQVEYHDAPKRPKELECDINYITALGERWAVIIEKLKGVPYGIFAFKEEKVTGLYRGSNKTEGSLKRQKRGIYHLLVDGEVLVEDISALMESDDERADTRKYSLMLRHGIKPQFIVEQIDKSPGVITSFNKAIARTIKKYVPENEQKKLVMKGCEFPDLECKIIMEEGCAKCATCGKSKCG